MSIHTCIHGLCNANRRQTTMAQSLSEHSANVKDAKWPAGCVKDCGRGQSINLDKPYAYL